jgi:hypothetical protein
MRADARTPKEHLQMPNASRPFDSEADLHQIGPRSSSYGCRPGPGRVLMP